MDIDDAVRNLPEDFDPAVEATLPSHVMLLVQAGTYIIENVT